MAVPNGKMAKRPEWQSDQDCRRLIAAIRQPVYRGCFALIYACGLRIGEALRPIGFSRRLRDAKSHIYLFGHLDRNAGPVRCQEALLWATNSEENLFFVKSAKRI